MKTGLKSGEILKLVNETEGINWVFKNFKS